MRILAYCVSMLAICPPLIGQTAAPDTARSELLAAKSLRCRFGPGVVTKWVGGKPIVGKADTLTGEYAVAIFDAIDLAKGSARSIGNVAAGDVAAVRNSAGITFLDAGTPTFDVVTVFGVLLAPHEFAAVDSRHFKFLDNIAGEQYYGSCSIWQ